MIICCARALPDASTRSVRQPAHQTVPAGFFGVVIGKGSYAPNASRWFRGHPGAWAQARGHRGWRSPPRSTPPAPGPRLYSGADDVRFQDLRQRLEQQWVAMLCAATRVASSQLPLLWDADFLHGERIADEERYVLCEINVSSVSPFPPLA